MTHFPVGISIYINRRCKYMLAKKCALKTVSFTGFNDARNYSFLLCTIGRVDRCGYPTKQLFNYDLFNNGNVCFDYTRVDTNVYYSLSI